MNLTADYKIAAVMILKTLAISWFRREDWARWRAIDPDFQPDYSHWLLRAELAFERHQSPLYVLEKVIIDPDEFLAWSRLNGGKVDTQARAAFAAIQLGKKHSAVH